MRLMGWKIYLVTQVLWIKHCDKINLLPLIKVFNEIYNNYKQYYHIDWISF